MMRKATQGAFFKYFIFGLLIIAFGSWGLADFVVEPQQHAHNEKVAEIEDVDITYGYFQQVFQRQFPNIPPKPEKIGDFDPARNLIANMVKEQLRNKEAQDLKLSISQEHLRQAIARSPSFQNSQGVFDPNLFRAEIGRSGLNEALFLEALRGRLNQDSLNNAVAGSLLAPNNVTKMLHEFYNTTRNFDVLVIDPKEIDIDETAPDTAILQKFYDDNTELFNVNERRDISFIYLDVAQLANDIKVSDDDISAFYNENMANYTQPRKLDFEQLLFTDEAKAKDFYNQLQDKTIDLKQANETAGNIGNFVILNDVALDAIPDAGLRDHILQTPINQIASPYQGPFGWVIARLIKDTPEVTMPLQDVSNNIQSQLASDKAQTELNRLRSTIDEELALGASLRDSANKYNVTLYQAKGVEETGFSNSEQFIPNDLAFLGFAFQAAPNIPDPIVVDTQDNQGFFALIVDNVAPAHIASFDAAQGKVKDFYFNQQRANSAEKRAKEILVEAHNSGKSLLDIANKYELSIESLGPLGASEIQQHFPLSTPIANRLFTSKENDKLLTPDLLGMFRVVHVTKVNHPDDQTNAQQLKEQSEIAYSSIIQQSQLNAFELSLENKFDTQIWLDRVHNVYQ